MIVTSCLLAVAAGGARASDDPLGPAQARATALRAELADLRTQAARAVTEHELAEAALSEAVVTSVALSRDVDAARTVAAGAAAQADRRVVALYKSSGQSGLLMILTRPGGAADLVHRTADLQAVLASDTELRRTSAAARHTVEEAEQRSAGVAAERVRLSGQVVAQGVRLAGLLEAQQERLGQADADVLRIVEEQRAEARRQAVAALLAEQRAEAAAMSQIGQASISVGVDTGRPYSGPDGTCPVGPVHNFTDSWHAGRSGGRQHQGTDVFAPKGSSSYAVRDGVIDKVGNSGLGGITLWLRTDNGDRFYYAHHDAQFVSVGQRVQAGQVLGHVGNSGNARTTPPHVHFEAHPGGGAAVNPYPWLAAICAG